MTTRRDTLAMLAAGAASLGLGRAASAQAKGELNVIWQAWPDAHVTPIFDGFKKKNPGVTLRDERLPFNELFQATEVRLQSRGPTPDIYIADGPLTASYAVRKHLQELDSIIGDLDRYTKAARDQGSFRGKLYTLPLFSSSQLLYINKKLFAEAGITPPPATVDGRWTWEQVVEAAKKLTDRSSNRWGLVIEQAERPYQLLPLAQSKGAAVIGPDGLTASGFVDSAPFIDAFRWYGELYTKHQVSPPNVFEINLAQELFATGRAAMYLGTNSNMSIFGSREGLDWTVAAHPYFSGGKPVTPTGSWHVGMNPRTKQKEAAEAFMRYLAEPATIEMQARARANPPVIRSVWDSMSDVLGTPGWKIIRHELDNTAVPRPATPGWREYEDILRIAIREITGGSDPAARLQKAAKDIDREMAKYRG
ncbi:extracellular solute-binding protein [Bosea sp. TWI1241]|uniref:ABC transporter substrate-binding protein n=1 Tax=Bosea sp. TWI1241 TaxID=3148904 RepID=UPI0032091C36